MNEKGYLRLLYRLVKLSNSTRNIRSDRTGVGTFSIFGPKLLIDLEDGTKFPLLTTKYVHFKSVAHELLWFLRGDTNVAYLHENGVTIWDEWTDENGDLGPVYGRQWRNWNGIDQIQNLIDGLKNDPFSRRHIVSAWNVSDLPHMALAPCHVLYQFYVTNDHKLHCQLYQRSADIFLGVPFNIASYALLMYMVGAVTGYTPSRLNIAFGDLHLYSNHITPAKIQLDRDPNSFPSLIVPKKESIDDFCYEDFVLKSYSYWPAIKAKVAV